MPLFCCYSDVELAANEMQEEILEDFFINFKIRILF